MNDEHTHVIAILKIHPHPEYTQKSKYNDIALMQLSEKVYFTEYVRPACLNIDNYLEWTDAIAIGFGRESFGNFIDIIIYLFSNSCNAFISDQMLGSQYLLKVHLNHSDSKICQQAYKVGYVHLNYSALSIYDLFISEKSTNEAWSNRFSTMCWTSRWQKRYV